MNATRIIIIVVVALVVLALIGFLVAMQRKKRREADAEHAARLRHEAQQHATGIPESQVRAKEAEVQAERARIEAERAERQAQEAHIAATQQQAEHEERIRAADRLDPNVDTRSSDYAPQTGVGGTAGTIGQRADSTTGEADYVRAVDADGRPVDDQVRPLDAEGRPTRPTDQEQGGNHRA